MIKQLVSEREQDLLERGEITEPFERTKTGAISTAQENHKFLAEKCGLDVVTDFAKYERAKKFHNDFLAKLDRDRIHPKFKNLKATGRLSCEGVNIQQIPKCGRSDLKFEPTCRQTMAPEVGHVFAIVDVHQLEGRSLAAFWKYQLNSEILSLGSLSGEMIFTARLHVSSTVESPLKRNDHALSR